MLATRLIADAIDRLEAAVADRRRPDGPARDLDQGAPHSDELAEPRLELLRAELETLAAPLTAALRDATARANGPDRRALSWDSYDYRGWLLEEWGLTVPFATLTAARRAVVPVTAAERILALPDDPPADLKSWERPTPGRAYRRYWAETKRFLTLVGDIAARFADDGGERLTRELLRRLRWLPDAERQAVLLHLAALGLTDDDAVPLAREVLGAAEANDLGGRGELVLQALRSLDGVPPERRGELLADAARVARRTTAFVASNPYASAVEALAQAEVVDLAELVELVDRAVRLKLHDWGGWDRAMHAASRSLTHLVRAQGVSLVDQAVAALRRFQHVFPGIEASCLLAGARGLPTPESIALTRAALARTRVGRLTVDSLRAEAEALTLLGELGAEGTAGELADTITRVRTKARGAAREVGLQVCVGVCLRLDPVRGPDTALTLAASIREAESRWLAYLELACAAGLSEATATDSWRAAQRAARFWLLRRPPYDLLVPLAEGLAAELPGGPRHPAVRGVARLAVEAAGGALAGQQFAAALMSLGPRLASPAGARGLLRAYDQLELSWWRLPLLALVADGLAEWLEGLARREASRHG